MSREHLDRARQLINEKKFEEAKAILRQIPNDPTAQKWLERLDHKAEASTTAGVAPQRVRLLPLYFLNLVIIALLAVLVLGVLPVKVVVNDPISINNPSEDSSEVSNPVTVQGEVSLSEPIDINGTVPISGSVTIAEPVDVNGVVSVAINEPVEVFFDESVGLLSETTAGPQKWEYLKVELGLFGIELDGVVNGYVGTTVSVPEYIQELGQAGWELVNVAYYELGFNNSFTVYEALFFKRPFREDAIYPVVVDMGS
jgi:hypothetical protein